MTRRASKDSIHEYTTVVPGPNDLEHHAHRPSGDNDHGLCTVVLSVLGLPRLQYPAKKTPTYVDLGVFHYCWERHIAPVHRIRAKKKQTYVVMQRLSYSAGPSALYL